MKRHNQLKATVIIPTYNRSKLLDYTLHSLSKQKTDMDKIEVIVTDDGSFDNTTEIVDKYQQRMNVRYFFQEDKGFRVASARNTGIRNAESDTLIFIDCGVLLGSSCIESHIKFHEANEKMSAGLGYVYGWDQYEKSFGDLINLINVDCPDKTIDFLRSKGAFLDMREPQYAICRDQLDDLPAPWVFFITCNISVRKSTLKLIGYFDENFDQRWGVEDLELGYRLYKNGGSFSVIRSAESVHYPHDTDMSEKFKQEVANKKYFHKKYNSIETELFLCSTFLELNAKLMSHKLAVL